MTARGFAGPFIACVAAACVQAHAAAPSRADFEAWKAQRNEEFAEHLSQQDREFSAFLKQQWLATRGIEGEALDRTPKPRVLPAVSERPPPAATPPVKLPPPPTVVAPVAPPVAVTAPAATPPVTRPPVAVVKVAFVGREVGLPLAPAGFDARLTRQGPRPDAIAAYWARVAGAQSAPVFEALGAARRELTLDDWPTAVLIGRYAAAIHPQAPDDAALLSWFMLCRAGLDARVAYHDSGILLLVRSAEDLFDTSYLEIGGKRYYAAPLDGSRRTIPTKLFTFEGSCPGSVRPIDFRVRQSPRTAARYQQRQLETEFGGQHLKVALDYDPDLVELLGTWPQMRIDSYFAAGVPPELTASWSRALRPLLEGRSESEAVDLLLALLQHGIPYQTDQQQFGREEYLFPVETLRYPAADCEDRAVLLAWLVRNMLGLDAVGLDFPGHVALAVRFAGAPSGEAIESAGNRYLVTDPTYIGAGVGQAMPGYPLQSARIVTIQR